MTIIAPLPFTLTNGTTADASEVMANLNQIRDDVNSNGTAIISQGGVSPYKGAVQGVGSSQTFLASLASNILLYSGNTIDTDSISGPIGKMIVPSGVSIVRLWGQVGVDTPAGYYVLLDFIKNGGAVEVLATHAIEAHPVNTFIQLLSPALSVTAGDYFQFRAKTNYSVDGVLSNARFEMQILG